MASSTCPTLLPLCSVPKLATREGMTGANAYMNIIGVGLWFASGQTATFPSAQATQDKSRTYVGTVKPDTYSKGFACQVPAACPV